MGHRDPMDDPEDVEVPRESGPVPVSPSDDPLAQTGMRRVADSPERLTSPTPQELLNAVLRLNRQISVEMHEEDIVHQYTQTLRQLFGKRMFVVRLIGPEDGRLSLVYATGRLDERRRESLSVSREAIEQHGLSPQVLVDQEVDIGERYQTVFADGSHGFDIPMMDGERLLGVLGVEYHPEHRAPDNDPPLVGQLALQLAAALRNARLLRESVYLRDYLSKLLDHANAPILIIGRHREIRVVNRAFLKLTGLRREQILGREFGSLLPDSERTRLIPVFVNALRGRPTSDFELGVPRAEGGMARIAVNVASFLSADGEVEGVIAIGRDITQVRQLEEQVVQAEKLATLGQLAAGVVHELNNPLTSISVYSEYLLKKHEGRGGEEGDAEKLRRIVESAQRILRFTRDLVTYARPSTEDPRVVSVHDVLDQAVVFCEHVIEGKGAIVQRRFADNDLLALGVKGQLHQVFINLITNACHAMPEGAGRLVLETRPLGRDRVEIRVQDNGAGIPPDLAERIFEPFFSTKGEGKGTGLGLSIVRNILHQHDGRIDLDSRLGEGTTFIVTLPRPVQR